MKTYRIVGRTNDWIAQRDVKFAGNTEITIESCLTLKEAYDMLLKMFCESAKKHIPNWGLAVQHAIRYDLEATPTRNDGTRSFEDDSRVYSIEEEE